MELETNEPRLKKRKKSTRKGDGNRLSLRVLPAGPNYNFPYYTSSPGTGSTAAAIAPA